MKNKKERYKNYFTFHDVSINTIFNKLTNNGKNNFTFHDVSINTVHP